MTPDRIDTLIGVTSVIAGIAVGRAVGGTLWWLIATVAATALGIGAQLILSWRRRRRTAD